MKSIKTTLDIKKFYHEYNLNMKEKIQKKLEEEQEKLNSLIKQRDELSRQLELIENQLPQLVGSIRTLTSLLEDEAIE